MRCNNEEQHIANNIEKQNKQKDLKHHNFLSHKIMGWEVL